MCSKNKSSKNECKSSKNECNNDNSYNKNDKNAYTRTRRLGKTLHYP